MDKEKKKKRARLEALAQVALRYFPGYTLDAMDPGIVLTRWERHLSGKSTPVDRISLSEMALCCLRDGKEPARVLREDL